MNFDRIENVNKFNYIELKSLLLKMDRYKSTDLVPKYTEFGVIFSINGDEYLFKYSRVFRDCVDSYTFMSNDYAFINWTRTQSETSEANRFIRKEYNRQGQNHVMIDGFPFKEENITYFGEFNSRQAYKFICKFIDKLMEYKKAEDIGEVSEEKTYIDTNKTQTTKADKMSKVTNIVNTTVDVNKEAIKLAAKLEIGKVATAQLKKVVKPKLPMMVRGYADSALFDIVLANAVGIALREYAPGNEKAQIVSEAMIQSAAVELMTSFNINDMVNDMLENIDISKITNLESHEA